MKILGLALLAALLFVLTIAGSPVLAATQTTTAVSGDSLALIGDLNLDSRYNLMDVVMLIRAIFTFPQDPYPVNGDVNCDHFLDVFDVIRLSDYVFAEGPALEPCTNNPDSSWVINPASRMGAGSDRETRPAYKGRP